MLEALIHFGLRKRLLVLVMGSLLATIGFYSYLQLPVDAFPDVSPNLVQVFTETEGLAPEEIEKFVTYPVEAVMNGLPGVKKIRSVSNFGLSVVNVYFEDDMNIYFVRQLVNERLQEARDRIPDGFGDPAMGPISTGMGLVLFYYLEDESGERSLEELRSIQDWLVKFHLQTVPGVTEILGIGGYEKQFQIRIDPEALLEFDVTITDVIERVRANNLNVGAQFIEKDAEEYIVRSVGLVTSVEDLERIVIKADDGRPVFLRQVADVGLGGAIRRGVQTRDGVTEVVSGMVVKLFGTNSSTVIADVEAKMVQINRILPDGITLVPYYEQKTLVEACIATVTSALLQGILLVAVILFVFMGSIRPGIVVALSIPFSILFATLGMQIFGISANLMSLGGLAIAIGMMVDGTIVMVENVDRALRTSTDGESRLTVVGRACVQVGRPILYAIGIIVIVFLPLFTLQGVEGKTFRPLAYTIALAMFGSLIFALILAPVLSNLLLATGRSGKDSGRGDEDDQSENFGDQFLTGLTGGYRPVVSRFVHHWGWAVAVAAILLGAGGMVYPRLGSEFTPALQEGTIVTRLTMAPSSSLTESKRLTMLVERRIKAIDEVTGVVTRIGRGEVGAHTDPINSAEMYVLLKPQDQWRQADSQEELVELIRTQLGEIPGILVNFTQPIEMAVDELLEGVRAELAIKLFGEDLEVMKTQADRVAAVVRGVRGAADVQVDQVSGTPQLLIAVNRSEIARYGLNVEDVQQVIRAAVGGEVVGEVFEGIRRFDILVRYREQDRATAGDVGRILIEAPNGIRVPLAEVATIQEIVGPRQITREDNQRFITVQCNVTGRDIGSFVAEAQQAIDKEVDLPPGYLLTWGGQFRLQQEANKRFAVVIPVTLLIVLLLLYSSFGSFKNSALILLNIPLALVGGIIALWLTDQNLSVPASVGFIALFGIALENGMVLVTYLNELVEEGVPIMTAAVEGACSRVRPVLMTASTTALGLIPLLFSTGTGSEVQRPLATVVVGGLVTSTVLTLLVIPALYRWFSDAKTSETRPL